MEREILAIRREGDQFRIYLDGTLWNSYVLEELRDSGVLWFKVGRAIKVLVDRRIAEKSQV